MNRPTPRKYGSLAPPPKKQKLLIDEDDCCTGCGVPCKKFFVKKEGPNNGKPFWSCQSPQCKDSSFRGWADVIPPVNFPDDDPGNETDEEVPRPPKAENDHNIPTDEAVKSVIDGYISLRNHLSDVIKSLQTKRK